jgi:DNA repair and recombination protein RAD52
VTDALKRSLRNFGNLLGNCLYDKSYTQEIVKIKVPVAKFDKSQLHRRPEFDESRQQPAAGPFTSTMTPIVKTETATKPLSSIPPHMRPGATPNTKPNTYHSTPPPPYIPNPSRPNPPAQLQTPIHAQPQPQRGQQISPQQHKPSQKVTFASPTRDADESFSYSDDDAFLAQVDLGEGDVGRPIDYEDISTGASTIVNRGDLSVGSDAVKGCVDTGARGSMGPPASVGGKNGQSNTNLQARQPHIQQRQDANSTSSSHNSNPYARVHNQNSSSADSHINSAPNSNPSISHPKNLNSSSNTAGPTSQQTDLAPLPVMRQQQPRLVQPNLASNLSSGQNIQNQNQAPHPNANVAPKKPVTPSMGGFHFPPGMVHIHISHSISCCVKWLI